MTQEEKAKAYDEALNKIKPLYEQAKKDGNPIWSTYEYLIPELAESEDERIRRIIMKFVWGYTNTPHSIINGDKSTLEYAKEVEAYLEKQKEQKPADEQFPPLEGLDAIKAKYYDDGFKNGFDEGVESVKPAEWSDTKELVFKDICNHLEVEGYGGWVVLLNALHNGEFQPKQEWSEEDEKYLNRVINLLVNDFGEDSDTVKWLKSLKPSWKPSEEQMKALERAITLLEKQGHFVEVDILKSIQRNLKKLQNQ